MAGNNFQADALIFSKLLKKASLGSHISFGYFLLKYKKGVKDKIQYNQDGMDLLKNMHEYTIPILQGELQISLQLYENLSGHFRLFCYSRFGSNSGMTFSVNLTTEKESDNVIYLTQKIKFGEQYEGSEKLAQAHRRQKQIVFLDLLKKLGFEVTDNSNIILGIFDPKRKTLVNTTFEKFLNDFIVISILKGHFQGNKGYQLEILPSFNKLDYIYTGKEEEIETLPQKTIKAKGKRHIPLGLRYIILKRDGYKCGACHRGPQDGVKLHVDHITPFSLGGLTEMKNLAALCEECNIGKSNRH